MADEPPIVCQVCGTPNPPTATDCKQCGIKLAGARKGAEVERLLNELITPAADEKEEADEGEEGGLDLDKEIVDELLDSLLVETAAPEAAEAKPAAPEVKTAEVFECPMCGADVAADAPECPSCHTKFAATATSAEPEAPAEAPAGVAPAMAVSEGEASKVGALSGRLIDLVVLGTTLALVGVFAGFGMWSWAAVATNPMSIVAFLLVALAGFGAGIVLFKLSTSAIAQGDRLVKEGRYEESIGMYDRAIRMGSRPATAWTSKGVAYKRLGRLDEAVRCHNAALKVNPKNEIAWCNKGAALAKMGRFEEARACHDKAVQLKPRYVAAWLNRGEVLARLGDRDEAQRCLDRAKALGA